MNENLLNLPLNQDPTPEQALQVVTNLVRGAKLSFDEHLFVIKCINTLAAVIQSQQPKP